MDNPEMKMLRQEIETLKARIDDLCAAQNNDREEFSRLIKDVYTNAYQQIANLYDIVDPIEAIVLPNAKAARKAIKSIVGEKKLSAGERWDRKTP